MAKGIVVVLIAAVVHIPPQLHVDSDCICMTVSDRTAYLSV